MNVALTRHPTLRRSYYPREILTLVVCFTASNDSVGLPAYKRLLRGRHFTKGIFSTLKKCSLLFGLVGLGKILKQLRVGSLQLAALDSAFGNRTSAFEFFLNGFLFAHHFPLRLQKLFQLGDKLLPFCCQLSLHLGLLGLAFCRLSRVVLDVCKLLIDLIDTLTRACNLSNRRSRFSLDDTLATLLDHAPFTDHRPCFARGQTQTSSVVLGVERIDLGVLYCVLRLLQALGRGSGFDGCTLHTLHRRVAVDIVKLVVQLLQTSLGLIKLLLQLDAIIAFRCLQALFKNGVGALFTGNRRTLLRGLCLDRRIARVTEHAGHPGNGYGLDLFQRCRRLRLSSKRSLVHPLRSLFCCTGFAELLLRSIDFVLRFGCLFKQGASNRICSLTLKHGLLRIFCCSNLLVYSVQRFGGFYYAVYSARINLLQLRKFCSVGFRCTPCSHFFTKKFVSRLQPRKLACNNIIPFFIKLPLFKLQFGNLVCRVKPLFRLLPTQLTCCSNQVFALLSRTIKGRLCTFNF